jgi:Secretion system C-terminal sorting domain
VLRKNVRRVEEKPQELTTHFLSVTARPNPSANYFTLDIRGDKLHPVTVRITDVLGRTISAFSGVASNSSLSIGHHYIPGVYLVQVIQDKETATLRLIKQVH